MDVVNHYKGKWVSKRSSSTNLCRSPWCKQALSDEGYKNKVPIPAPELPESWLWSDVWAFGKYENATKATQSSPNACTPMRTPNFQSRQQMTIKWTNQKAGLPLTSDWLKKSDVDFHTITTQYSCYQLKQFLKGLVFFRFFVAALQLPNVSIFRLLYFHCCHRGRTANRIITRGRETSSFLTDCLALWAIICLTVNW